MSRLLYVFCALLVTRPVLGDGAYVPVDIGAVTETTDQRALLVFEPEWTTLVLQTGYRGDGTGFSWVVPIAQLVAAEDVFTASPELFTWLHELTAPRLVSFSRGCGVAGCKGEDAELSARGAITVFDSFQVDGYEVTVLGASESADLSGWLASTGHVVPAGAEAVFDDYASRDFIFVAVRFDAPAPVEPPAEEGGDPTARAGDPDGGPGVAPPLAIRLPGHQPVFPMVISSVSTAGEVDILLYVAAAERYAATSYETRAMEIDEVYDHGDFDAWYDGRLEARLANDPAFVVEYAAPVPYWEVVDGDLPAVDLEATDWFVTRMHARLQPEQMLQDVDVAPAQGPTLEIRVMRGGKAQAAAALVPWDLALLLALGLAVHSRTRRRR